MVDRLPALVDPVPVCVRAVFVRGDHDQFRLMKRELIEPSLYLRKDAAAPARSAAACNERVRPRLKVYG